MAKQYKYALPPMPMGRPGRRGTVVAGSQFEARRIIRKRAGIRQIPVGARVWRIR